MGTKELDMTKATEYARASFATTLDLKIIDQSVCLHSVDG